MQQDEQGRFYLNLDAPFQFECGDHISPLELVFEAYGQLSEKKDNAILIHHALSTNSHVRSHEKNMEKGWWEMMVGPNCPIDTNRFFVICINNIASCFGSSGPLTIKPFPETTMRDIARSQKFIIDALGIQQLYAVVGSSMGGMISLSFALEYPELSAHLILISSCYKAYPANIANRLIQREIILLDDEKGFKTARKLGHLTYRNIADLNQKFEKAPHQIKNYLAYKAEQFTNYFNVDSYLHLLDAMDSFDLTHEDFSKIKARVLVVSVDSDILFTPQQQDDLFQKLNNAGVDVQYIHHHSPYGHDTFLVEINEMGRYFKHFWQR